MDYTTPIDLGISDKLTKNKSYRNTFFRALVTDSIALQIRKLRKLRELNQADLAKAAEMRQSAVSRIEQSEYSSWTFNTLSRVAEALDSRLIVTFQPMEDAIQEYKFREGKYTSFSTSNSVNVVRGQDFQKFLLVSTDVVSPNAALPSVREQPEITRQPDNSAKVYTYGSHP